MAFLLGVSAERLTADQGPLGSVVETFVIMELWKQATWSRTRLSFFHFRTHAQREVDVVLEDRRGRVVGIEIKRAGSVGAADFAGLRALQEAAGRHFWRGVIFYQGVRAVPFGNRFDAPADPVGMGHPRAPSRRV